jgi:hypothetical protein
VRVLISVVTVLLLTACTPTESRYDLEAKIPEICRRGSGETAGYSKACVRGADPELAKKLGLGAGAESYVDEKGQTISGSPDITAPPATGLLLAGEMPVFRVVFSTEVLVAPIGLDIDVVIGTLSRADGSDRIELVCRSAIALSNANRGSCYNNEEARNANNSEIYRQAHPEVSLNGYLGRLELGEWTAA